MTPCEVAQRLEGFCEIFFELERSSKRWRVLETSFTDVIIASFRAGSVAKVNVDASIEKTTGADIEIMFSPATGSPYVFVVQAKRASPSSLNSPNWSYRELFHKPRTSSKFQVQTLIDHCAIPHPFPHIPIYAFYHSQTAAASIAKQGITCLHASEVHSELTKKLQKKRGIHLCNHYASKTIPFHKLFCRKASAPPKEFLKDLSNYNWTNNNIIRSQYMDNWLSFDGDWEVEPASNARILIEL